jgi:hypothetical protein
MTYAEKQNASRFKNSSKDSGSQNANVSSVFIEPIFLRLEHLCKFHEGEDQPE